MFNKNVRGIVKALRPISNSVVFRYPETVFCSPSGDVLVKIDISKLDQDEFKEFGIFDVSNFLGILDIFSDDAEITIGNPIQIKDENSSSTYITTSLEILNQFDKSPEIFKSVDKFPSVLEFVITKDDILKIKSAANTFKELGEISINGSDSTLIKLESTNNFNLKTNTFELRKPEKSSKEFNIKIPVQNFNLIPSTMDYNVLVKYNEERDAYRVIFKCALFDILLATKAE